MSDQNKYTVFTIALLPFAIGLGGLVLSMLWNWFLASLFESVPMIGFAQGAGLLLLIEFAVFAVTGTAKDDGETDHYRFEDAAWDYINKKFFVPTAVLALGYVIAIIAGVA